MNKAFESRHINGTIIASLQAYYPNGLGGANILNSVLRPLFPGMEWDQAFAALSYLQGRGLLEVVKSQGPRGGDSPRERVYRLTPAGMDVAAGIVADPAVLVEV